VSIGPAGRYNLGQTEYILEGTYLADGTSGPEIVRIKSQLEYPLDVPMMGGRIDVDVFARKRLDFSVSATVLMDVKDPSGTMLDRDWTNDFEFSHTDSEVRQWSIYLDLEFAKWVASSDAISFYIVGGVKGQRISQDLIGLEGWQIFDSTYYFNFMDLPVGLYEISYAMPHIGIMPKYTSGRVSLDLKAAVALVVVSDQDHHLLRNFTAESSGTGRGVIGRGRFRYDFPAASTQGNVFLELSGDFLTVKAALAETMTWYGDDPVSEEDDTGDEARGVPHEIKSTQYGFGVTVGYRF
jgi:outer membrane protease